jgi:hypothetical protein
MVNIFPDFFFWLFHQLFLQESCIKSVANIADAFSAEYATQSGRSTCPAISQKCHPSSSV